MISCLLFSSLIYSFPPATPHPKKGSFLNVCSNLYLEEYLFSEKLVPTSDHVVLELYQDSQSPLEAENLAASTQIWVFRRDHLVCALCPGLCSIAESARCVGKRKLLFCAETGAPHSGLFQEC